jgi:membrane fusion protein, copper/silver efflux system
MSSDSVGHHELLEGEEAPPPGVRVMCVIRWLLVAAAAALAIYSVVDFAGVFAKSASEDSLRYQCPMHPSVVQDQPGECPICGMTLVPIKDGPSSLPAVEPSDIPGHVTVELTPDRVQLIGLKTEKVANEELGGGLRTVGFIAANEDGLAEVHTRFSGWIEELQVSETGQRVKAGQVLAEIYSPEILNAQRELLNALRWEGERASSLADDARHKLELLGISKSEIDRISKTKEVLHAIPIRTPVSGHVITKSAIRGAYVEPAAKLFEISDLSRVWAIAEVYERDLAKVKPGQKARFFAAAHPGRAFEGEISLIYPLVDQSARTLRVRIDLLNPKLELRPGMYGDIEIELPSERGLVVSRDAIVETGSIAYVFVALEGGRFEPRRVRTGARFKERVEILEGLSEGEIVVTTGNFMIDSESRLRAAVKGVGHQH